MSVGVVIAASSTASAAIAAVVLRLTGQDSGGNSTTSILVQVGVLIGLIVTAILQLRNGWKQDTAKKEVLDEVAFVKAKQTSDSLILTETHKNTNSMAERLEEATRELATMKERARADEEARKLLVEAAKVMTEAEKARAAGVAQGTLEEKARQEKDRP